MKLLWLWGPVVVLMAVIFAGSSTADLDPLPGRFTDKLAHTAVYALLGALFGRALAGGRATQYRHVVIAVVLSTLYGVSDEWHQSFVPGRTPDAMDVVADAIGATVGAVGYLLWSRLVRTGRAIRAETQN